MQIRVLIVRILWCVTAIVGAAWCGELPRLSGTRDPFTFVILGDIHYKRPDFKSSALVREIGSEIKEAKPPVDFVCHTGDLVEGGVYSVVDGKKRFTTAGYADMKEELTFAMKDIAASLGKPVFLAVGNHDKHDPGHKAYQEIVLPVLSHQLGVSLSRTFYGFLYGNSCFVFLDFLPPDFQEQQAFVEAALVEADRAGGVQHVFLFAHYPLWAVVRSGFDSPGLTESLLPVLRKHRTDAYFCGHTHNAVVCVRSLGGAEITQIKGVVCQGASPLAPIEERYAPLFPPEESFYCWGYCGGLQGSYYEVAVEGARVGVQLRVPGKGAIREFDWQAPGKLRNVKKPDPLPAVCVTEDMLRQATKATLHFCPWADDRTQVDILLNGEQIAQEYIGPTYCPFWDRKQITIPKDKIGLLRTANVVTIGNPTKAFFAIAHARIEVVLADGRTARTPVSVRIFFSSTEAEAKATGKPRGWRMAPPHMIQAGSLGTPLGPIELTFPVPAEAEAR